MGDKDSKFTFGQSEQPAERDPTVRDVHKLELEQTQDPAKPASGYNPYDRDPKAQVKAAAPAPDQPIRTSTTTRTDLRKLSEWIKLRQEVEARKVDERDAAERVPTVKIPRPKI